MSRFGPKRGSGASEQAASPSARRRATVTPIRAGHPTVGLITAIPEEFTAMRYLLDQHAEQYVDNDPTRYIVGVLPSPDKHPPHRVALAMLGANATDGAADGCANMLRSFASIKMIIMVGIAAGVPNVSRPLRHVRLGDIVVATEGIVAYDHVHVGPDGLTQRKGLLSPSPRLTRCADILKSEELSGHRPWEEWLDVTSRSELAAYVRPHERTDQVYNSAGNPLDHPRRDRSQHRKGYPKVHYGLIGSADRSLSDVATRDRIAAEHNVLAIEMEAAAIATSSSLNGREWFVVRGVSDYGDSQRNETWRKYASLAAAAYVRSLLANCLPSTQEGDHRNGPLSRLL